MPLLLDITSFEALFQVNYKPLCATAIRIVQDKAAAEDIVQDIFIKLWEKRQSLEVTTSLKSYLFQSTINQSLNHIKKAKNLRHREDDFGTQTGGDVNTTENMLVVKETARQIDSAIGSLPDACRNVFVLSRYEHLSYKAIAEHLGISVKTVENQMVKALKHLRKALSLFFVLFFI